MTPRTLSRRIVTIHPSTSLIVTLKIPQSVMKYLRCFASQIKTIDSMMHWPAHCIIVLQYVAMVQRIIERNNMFDNVLEISLAALSVGAVAVGMKVVSILAAAI